MKAWLQLQRTTTALRRLFFADSVRLEVSSKCQLKCPTCPTATGFNRQGVVGWGNLSLANFEKFISASPHASHIEISNWGEIFLNPDLTAIIKCAYDSGIELTADNGANFNFVRDDTLEAMAKYRFKSLTVAIDGATPESYRDYRKGGDFDRVIANVEKLNAYKRRYRSRHPILTWQFVPFGHNEHELRQARSKAKSLGMNFSTKLNVEGWGPQYSPVRDHALVGAESEHGAASPTEFREKFGHDYLTPCQDLWVMPQINWDGKLLGCCVNMWGDFGNVFETGLDECLTSEKYAYTQRMLLGEVPARADSPCIHCHLYRTSALPNLLNATPFPRISRGLLRSRIAARRFHSVRRISIYVRQLRGWMNQRRSHPATSQP